MVESIKKTFALVNEKGEEIGKFVGRAARIAAIKAARKGHVNIVLREKGTKKLHYFKGSITMVAPSKSAPAWIVEDAKAHGGKIKKANVEKIGIAHMEYVQLTRNNPALFKVPKAKA
jgi:hypothetical protein